MPFFSRARVTQCNPTARSLPIAPPDYFELRRFLRARTYDLERATVMWLDYKKWQQEFSVSMHLHAPCTQAPSTMAHCACLLCSPKPQVHDILTNFTFEERLPFIAAYPQARSRQRSMCLARSA